MENNINFDQVTWVWRCGRYVPGDFYFSIAWNESNELPEVINTLKSEWQRFKNNNMLMTNSKGITPPPSFTPAAVFARASGHRKKGVYMKGLRDHKGTETDWNKIAEYCKKYDTGSRNRFNFGK